MSESDDVHRASVHAVTPDPSFRPVDTAPSAFLTSLRASLPPGSTTMRHDGRALTWRPHRLDVEIHAGLYDTPAGPTHVVESRIPIAQNLGNRAYLAMLAMHGRRLDAIGSLVLDDGGQLDSHVRMFLGQHHFTPIQRDDTARSILASQALQAELLARESLVAGIISNDELTTTSESRAAQHRPDALFTANAELARRGMRRINTVTLEGTSKLGPWFVGTQQDDMLSERLNQGWRRLPHREHHGVRLIAPDDQEHIAEVRINWAHHSSLYGPALLLAVISRLPLGRQPDEVLRVLNRQPDAFASRARTGTWLPESWDHPKRTDEHVNALVQTLQGRSGDPIETQRIFDLLRQRIQLTERATFVVAMPTALAAPGGLAVVWKWAEDHVQDATNGPIRSIN